MSEPRTPPTPDAPRAPAVTRRGLLRLGIALNAVVGVLLALPIIGYVLSPARKKALQGALEWIRLGDLASFPAGETRLATFRNPFVHPWDGATGDIPCWVRHVDGPHFQVFAVNCTHLGCPVRWFAQSALFMCPCHGGAYYADGERASGPPPRGLFQYDYKLEGDGLWIRAGQMPTLSQQACAGKPRSDTCA